MLWNIFARKWLPENTPIIFLSENCNIQDQPQDSGRAKKTDEAQEDHEDDAEEEIEFNENEDRESPRPSSKASKADLDEPITSSSVDEEEAEDNEVSECFAIFFRTKIQIIRSSSTGGHRNPRTSRTGRLRRDQKTKTEKRVKRSVSLCSFVLVLLDEPNKLVKSKKKKMNKNQLM